jgi:ribosome-associated protein
MQAAVAEESEEGSYCSRTIMLPINDQLAIPLNEIEFEATRAQGAGGQHVNKSATAVQLRFDVRASSLPELYKTRLLRSNDRRISQEGVIVIKAQGERSQEQNREEALQRLQRLVQQAILTRKPRKATQPSASARQRRLTAKKQRSALKTLRGKVSL